MSRRGAVNSCHYCLNLLESGDHVVAGDDVYGGTHRLFRQVYEQYDLSFDFVDITDREVVDAAMGPDTELLWVETPTNPLMRVDDMGRCRNSPTSTARCVRSTTPLRRRTSSGRSNWAPMSSHTR